MLEMAEKRHVVARRQAVVTEVKPVSLEGERLVAATPETRLGQPGRGWTFPKAFQVLVSRKWATGTALALAELAGATLSLTLDVGGFPGHSLSP